MPTYPPGDLQALIRLELVDVDQRWHKPIRSRAMYQQFKCRRPKRNIKTAGDCHSIMTFIPCWNTTTCQPCCDWENFLHVERVWRGKPQQMIVISGFGDAASTIAETVGLAKVYRGQIQDRLRENPAVHEKTIENPSSERRGFISALAVGDDYRGALTLFFSSPLSG